MIILVLAVFAALSLLTISIGYFIIQVFAPGEHRDAGGRRLELASLSPIIGAAAVCLLGVILMRAGLRPSLVLDAVLLLGVAAAGYTAFKGGRRSISDLKVLGLLLLVSLAIYLVLLAPVLVSGELAITGYNVANDSVPHVIVADYLRENGYTMPEDTESSYRQAAMIQLFEARYPIGFHTLLGLTAKGFKVDTFSLYNPIMAYLSSLVVFLAFAALRFFGLGKRAAMVGSAVAPLSFLLLGYYAQAFAPQISAVPFLYTGILLSFWWLTRRDTPAGLVAPLALCLSAAFAIYSFIALLLPGLAFLLFIPFGLKNGEPGGAGVRRLLAKIGLLAAAMLLLNLSGMADSLTFLGSLRTSMGGSAFGNLPGIFVSPLTLLGVWFGPDYRYPLLAGLTAYANYLMSAAAIIILLIGVFRMGAESRRFSAAALVAFAAPVIGLRILGHPYSQAKILHLSSLLIGLIIIYGASELLAVSWGMVKSRSLMKTGAALLSVGVVGAAALGLAVSDWHALGGASLTPQAKLDRLAAIDGKYASKYKAALFIEQEDWGAYLLKDLSASSPLDQAFLGREVRLKEGFDRYSARDFNSLEYNDMSGFDLLVISRRYDVALLPPDFSLLDRDRYYSVYRRDKEKQEDVLRHTGFARSAEGATELTISAGTTETIPVDYPADGVLLMAAGLDGAIVEQVEEWTLPEPGWFVWTDNAQFIVSTGTETRICSGMVEVPAEGEYRVLLKGIAGNGVTVLVDGKAVGSKRYVEGLETVKVIGETNLAAGPHTVTLKSLGKEEINYIDSVILQSTENYTAPVMIAAGQSSTSPMVSLKPSLVQSEAVVSAGLGSVDLRITNPTPYPLNIQWIEAMRRPYPESLLRVASRENGRSQYD